MQTSLPSGLSTVIKPVSLPGGTAASTLPMKRLLTNSHPPSFHSTSKPSLQIEKYYGETSKRTSPVIVNATRLGDKGGEGVPDQSKSGGSYNALSVFAGVICNLIKGVIHFMSLQKTSLEKFEDKIENAVDMVEEVADTVKQVANVTEDIAEKIEQHSKDGEPLHETAEFLDNISEKVSEKAEIGATDAEQIKKNLKSIGTDMEAVESSLEDIGDRLSKSIANRDERLIQTKNSLDPELVTKSDQSV